MEEIGYEDYFYGDGLTLIEWAGQIKELLPEKRTEVTIQKDLEKGFDDFQHVYGVCGIGGHFPDCG